MDDGDVAGVFVSASPRSHYSISSRVLRSGKSLFVEKPVGYTLGELSELNGIAERHGAKVAMVGMQKRYSPSSQILQKELKGSRLINYNYRYTTGLYPEGDALVELFIHPLDYVTFLFGEAEIAGIKCIRTGNCGIAYLLVLQHEHIAGVLELSSAYTWGDAQEMLTVNTGKGVYTLGQMEELTLQIKPTSFCGLPIEKVFPKKRSEVHFCERNNFIPSLANNQIYSQGYYNEIVAFLNANERNCRIKSSLCEMFPTYRLIEKLRNGQV